MKRLSCIILTLLTLLLAACSGSPGGSATNGTPTPPPVNGFGIAANHTHSMVILPDAQHTLVLATHYGIFRSQDHGASWQQTSGGPNQLIQGLMTWWLSYNPLDPQRLYVVTLPVTIPHKGTLGLYTSGDGGKTWQLAIPDTSVTSSSITFAQAGNESPSEVYIYLHELGTRGLRVSKDNGQHFAQAGSALPFGDVTQILAVPGASGHLVAYGADGMASTTDGGQHWQAIKNVQDNISDMTTAGPNDPIYASGYNGIYISRDGGQSFTLEYTQHSYNSLSVSPQQPEVVYGKLGLGVYRSADGGQNWQAMPAIQGNLTVLVADPANANQVYLATSYPTGVYLFQATNRAWKSITPPVA